MIILLDCSGRLYYDWPWESSGRREYSSQWSFLRLLGGALEMVNNMPDSVFFTVTFDFPFLPANFPMPALSHGPKISNSDIPYPWTLLVNDEIIYHNNHVSKLKSSHIIDLHNDACKETDGCGRDLNPDNETLWHQREEKAAFFGTLWFTPVAISRQIVLHLAKIRPDLVVANYSKVIGAESFHPYSKPRKYKKDDEQVLETYPFDYIKTEAAEQKLVEEISLVNGYMAKYKFLLVLGGMSSSERLATFLAHSGAVILLQETDILYHFTPRIKPWIHYVPLSYTASDIIEKIEWLKAHDSMAREIARNGYVFGKNYLRLEDYYCYAAQALYAFSKVVTPNALAPYNITPVPP